MANLTATLSEVNGDFRTIGNDGAGGGGGFSTAISALSKGLGALTDQWDKNVRDKRQAAADARQAKADAKADLADTVANDTLVGLNNVENGYNRPAASAISALPVDTGPPVPADIGGTEAPILSEADSGFVNKSIARLGAVSAAVEQGRMPTIAASGNKDTLRNQLFEKFAGRPGALEQVAKIYKDQGFDLFPEINEREDFADAQSKAKREEFFKTVDIGKSLTPYDPSITDQQYYENGRAYTAKENERKGIKEAAEMRAAANRDTEAGIKFDREEEALNQFEDGRAQMYNSMDPALKAFLKLSQTGPGVGQSAEFETKLAGVTAHLEAVYNSTMTSILRNVKDPQMAARLRDELQKDYEAVIKNPIVTRREAFTAAAGVVGTAFKLSMSEVAPVIQQMRALNVNMEDIPEIINSLTPEVKAQIGREMKAGLNPKMGRDVGRLRLLRAIDMLDGTVSLRDMSTNQARQELTSDASRYVIGAAQKVAQGAGNPKMWLNAAAQMPSAAATVTRGAGPEVLGRAMAVIVSPNQVNAMNKLLASPEHGEQAKLVAAASRASVAHLVQETHSAANGTAAREYQGIIFNRDAGRFELRFNDAAWRRANPGGSNNNYVGEAMGTYAREKPKAPSAALIKLLGNLNSGIQYLTQTTKWEPGSAPTGSAKDVAEFWATGETTGTSLDKKSAPKRQEADAIKAIDAFDRDLGDPSRFLVKPDGANSDIIGPEGTGKNPRSSAVGIGQFTEDTWVTTLSRHAPDEIKGMSRSEILKLRTSKPELAKNAVGWYRDDNARDLQKAGLPATRENTALAHFAGSGGATALLKADPSAPVERVLGPKAVNANPHLKGKTVAETIAWAKNFYA